MSIPIVFVYDGQCPFCHHFAELLALKSNLKDIKIVNARETTDDINIPQGYDMDKKGALLIKGDGYLYGANAVNWICSQIKNPSDKLLMVLVATFSSNWRAKFIFPFLIIARRITLYFKGIPCKLVF